MDEKITISKAEYLDLISLKTRAEVAVSLLVSQKHMYQEEILRVLGTELAVERADELEQRRLEEEAYYANELKKHST